MVVCGFLYGVSKKNLFFYLFRNSYKKQRVAIFFVWKIVAIICFHKCFHKVVHKEKGNSGGLWMRFYHEGIGQRPLTFLHHIIMFNKKHSTNHKKATEPRHYKVNTVLCVDVKEKLRHDPFAIIGKNYLGVLTRDKEFHYTFQEVSSIYSLVKRNTKVFEGQFITITRRKDETLRPNFKPMKLNDGLTASSYATGVANELLFALSSLLGK